jgi:hypothetical protein
MKDRVDGKGFRALFRNILTQQNTIMRMITSRGGGKILRFAQDDAGAVLGGGESVPCLEWSGKSSVGSSGTRGVESWSRSVNDMSSSNRHVFWYLFP